MAAAYKVRVLNPGSDLPAVAALLASEVPAYAGVRKTAADFLKRLRWLIPENPDLGSHPPGWVLEAADGGLAGVHLSVPRLFCGAGGPLPVFFSCYYFVKAEARGMESLGLFLSYRKLASHGILMAGSANANSAPLWWKLGGKPLPGTDAEWLQPLHYPPLVEEFLHRRTGWKWRLPRRRDTAWKEPPAAGALRWLRAEEEILSAALPPGGGPLQPVRSPEWLRWKFIAGRQDNCRLYCWSGGAAPVFLTVTLANRGWRGQLRCLHLADAWSSGPPGGPEILRAITSLHRGHADAVVIRAHAGMTPAAASLGWRRRPLEAPVFQWAAAHAARLEHFGDFYPDSGT